MAYNIQDGFKVETAKAIDDRFVFADLTARNALNALYRYEGLTTYVIAEGKYYSLVGGVTNAEWVEGAGGGGGVLVVADTAARDAIDAGDRYEGMIVYTIADASNYQLRGGLLNANWVKFGGGGITVAADITARDAIVSGDRYVGMMVLVIDAYDGTSAVYYLQGGILNANWQVLPQNYTAAAVRNVLASGTIIISGDLMRQVYRVAGNGGPQTMGILPFLPSTTPRDGLTIMLIGTDDANTVTIPGNDATNGVLPFDVTLARGQMVTYVYNAALSRYIVQSVTA